MENRASQSQDEGANPISPLHFDKKAWKVEPVFYNEVLPWFLKKHYAHRLPSISYCFGLYENKVLKGVCSFGLLPSPEVCLLFGEENKEKVLELNRLCVNDGLPKNALSFFVSRCLKSLPEKTIVVSYADSGQNHHGYIYQATNFVYTGITKKQFDLKIKGTNKHSRHVYDNKDVETERVERTQKHRYFYFCGDEKFRNESLDKCDYKQVQYPKGDNKRYDASYNPEIQGIFGF